MVWFVTFNDTINKVSIKDQSNHTNFGVTMSYTIKRYGQPTITVPDGTINTETSITLVGKNYAGYGQFLDQNSMNLLQNFAGESPPSNPQYGQLWFDAFSKNLNLFDGAVFKGVASSKASATAPVSPVIGDMWFNTTDNSLSVYNGDSWVLIGPSVIKGTGVVSTYIEDTTGLQHAVVEILVGTAVVGIISKDVTFTPLTTIPGFTVIGPGYNVAQQINGVNQFYNGTATNALTLQGYDPAAFMSSVANTSTVGHVNVLSNAGLTTGPLRNFSFMNSSIDGIIENDQPSGNIVIALNVGGTITNVATYYGSNGDSSFSGNVHANYVSANYIYSNTIIGGYSNANVTAYLNSPGSTSNIQTSGYFKGDGSYLTNLPNAYSNSAVAQYLSSPGSSANIKTALYFIGDGSKLTNITASNITGSYGNANVAAYMPVYLPTNNSSIKGNIITANYFIGDGSLLSNLNIANAPGAYGNSNVAAFLTTYTGDLAGNNLVLTGNVTSQSGYFYKNVVVFNTSDQKYKVNVRDIDNALEIVEEIGGQLFDWTDEYLEEHGGEDGYFFTKEDFGFIAQKVQKAFPKAVRQRADGTLALDYAKMSALAFAAIAQLSKQLKKQ